MYPIVPEEAIASALQLAFCFFTVIVTLVGCVLGIGR